MEKLDETYIKNIIACFKLKKYAKTIIININNRIINLAISTYFEKENLNNQYNKLIEIYNEKKHVIDIFNIFEESLKDLRLNDFVILNDYYYYNKNYNLIMKNLGCKQRAFYRRLHIAKNNLIKNIKKNDPNNYIKNLHTYNFKYFYIFKRIYDKRIL